MKIEWVESRGVRIYVDGAQPKKAWVAGGNDGWCTETTEEDGSMLKVGGLIIFGVQFDVSHDAMWGSEGDPQDPELMIMQLAGTRPNIEAKVVKVATGKRVKFVDGHPEHIDEHTMYILADTEA